MCKSVRTIYKSTGYFLAIPIVTPGFGSRTQMPLTIAHLSGDYVISLSFFPRPFTASDHRLAILPYNVQVVTC